MEIRLHRFDVQDIDYRELKPLQGDLKILEDENYQRLKNSITEKGLFLPIFVWKKGKDFFILDGHGREKFFRKEGAVFRDENGKKTHKIPCLLIKAKDEKDAKEKILVISSQYQTITATGFDAFTKDLDAPWLEKTTFFDALQKKVTVEEEEGGDEDDVPEAGDGPGIAKAGDLWALGDHRVLCGDSTLAQAFDVLMGDAAPAAMVFTDPPYGVSYQANEPWRKGKNFSRIKNDELTGDRLAGFLGKTFKALVQKTRNEAAFYIWHPAATREDFFTAMKAAGLVERQYLIWIKPLHVIGHADYHWQHESCFYAAKDGQEPLFVGDRSQFSVWRIGLKRAKDMAYSLSKGVVVSDGKENEIFVTPSAPKAKKCRRLRIQDGQAVTLSVEAENSDVWTVGRDRGTEHPTQKPVELSRRAISNSSQVGDIVLDPFLGSGSTLIGAEVARRRCFGIEIDPKYCDLIIRRWQDFTKKKASKIGNFKTKAIS